MNLKLISIELSEETIQVAYTDGQSVDNAKQLVLVRLPAKLDLKKPMLWNQMNAMRELGEWANLEFRRLREELEKM